MKLFLAPFAAVLFLANSWLLDEQTAFAQKPSSINGSASLDGMTFSGQIVRDGIPVVDVVDNWVFEHGTFLSTECAVRCNYPRAPYFTRSSGGKTEFMSESRCTDQDAIIVWRGTIDNGTIKGVKRWTVKRWYWTIVKEFEFVGKFTGDPNPVEVTHQNR